MAAWHRKASGDAPPRVLVLPDDYDPQRVRVLSGHANEPVLVEHPASGWVGVILTEKKR